MRELLAEEMRCVAGGLVPQDPINPGGVIVHPDPGQGGGSLPYNPPSTGGDPHGGGGSAPGGGGGGGLTSQQLAGLARIKAELGIDLTAYAKMSPTLAQQISLATATYNFHFAYDAAGSHTNWTDQVSGTVYINSAYQNDALSFIQQMTHELEHVAHRVSDNPLQTPAETYINHYLETEGYCTLANERVRAEIKSNSGQDINIAGKVENAATYNAEYSKWATGQENYTQAAQNIGAFYGQHESTQGMSYHDYYLSEYHRLGGTQ